MGLIIFFVVIHAYVVGAFIGGHVLRYSIFLFNKYSFSFFKEHYSELEFNDSPLVASSRVEKDKASRALRASRNLEKRRQRREPIPVPSYFKAVGVLLASKGLFLVGAICWLTLFTVPWKSFFYYAIDVPSYIFFYAVFSGALAIGFAFLLPAKVFHSVILTVIYSLLFSIAVGLFGLLVVVLHLLVTAISVATL